MKGRSNVGGLIGWNGATVMNASANPKGTGAHVSGDSEVGGLIGYNEGPVANSSAGAGVTVTGTGKNIGPQYGKDRYRPDLSIAARARPLLAWFNAVATGGGIAPPPERRGRREDTSCLDR